MGASSPIVPSVPGVGRRSGGTRAFSSQVGPPNTAADAVADGVTVVPSVPFEGVAPGQTAVLYDGTRVIGQFTIDRTVSAVPTPV